MISIDLTGGGYAWPRICSIEPSQLSGRIPRQRRNRESPCYPPSSIVFVTGVWLVAYAAIALLA